MKEKILITIGTLGVVGVLVAISNAKTKKREKETEECLNATNDFIKTIDETQRALDEMIKDTNEQIIDEFVTKYDRLSRDQKKILWKVIG